MGMVQEFKEFIAKGNVMDLAVGVIIGGAFGTIVSSMTDDIIMPIVGLAGEADFTNYYLPLSGEVTATTLEGAREQGAVLAYGAFITNVVNFLILAFVVFLLVKVVNRIRREDEDPAAPGPAEEPAPPADVQLLGEIRDLLAGGAGAGASGGSATPPPAARTPEA